MSDVHITASSHARRSYNSFITCQMFIYKQLGYMPNVHITVSSHAHRSYNSSLVLAAMTAEENAVPYVYITASPHARCPYSSSLILILADRCSHGRRLGHVSSYNNLFVHGHGAETARRMSVPEVHHT